jgi:hypothetical protein
VTVRATTKQLSLLLAALLAAVAAGCGGDEETGLPQDRSDRLLALLDEAEDRFREGDCDGLNETLQELANQVNDEIPEDVDPQVRSTLSTETQELANLALQCEPEVVTETLPPETETVAPPPTVPTVPTETVPTETQPTDEDGEEGENGDNSGPGSSSNGPPGQGNGSEGPPNDEGGEIPDGEEQADAPGGRT